MSAPVRIYLVDGSSYIYRAFFAIRDLQTSQGVPTNAIYGFTTMLMKVLREFRPTHLAVIFDAKGPTFRHQAYEHYKANRPEMPERLRPQIPSIKEITRAMGIPFWEKEGFEADDLIGTLARRGAALGEEIVLISGDKDLFQLIGPRITMVDTMFDRTSDEAKVRDRFGVSPDRLPDIFGLMGDDSDNIPGVPGIGEKRAKELIQRFGSLEELLARADEVTQKKLRESLIHYGDQARLSKRLATIDTQVPLDVSIEDLRMGSQDDARLRAIFKEMEFHRLLQEWTPREVGRSVECPVLCSPRDLEELVRAAASQGELFVHVEGSSGDSMRAELLGVALATGSEPVSFVPLPRAFSQESTAASPPDVPAGLRRLLEDEGIRKIGHDIKAGLVLLARHGIALRGGSVDTMVASYVLHPTRRAHALEDLSLEYLDRRLEGAGVKRGGKTPDPEGTDLPSRASERVNAIRQLREILMPQVQNAGLETLYHDLEMPLIPVLARMEMNGVRVDVGLLGEISRELNRDIGALEGEIRGLAEGPFNIQSPQQLGQVLFEKLKLPVAKKTKTGYSTDMEVLRDLAQWHPLPAKVLEYRSLTKLKSTYVDALPLMVHPSTGRIHTSFNQAVTATGRLSSSEPNLQNIPVRTEVGQRIRQSFIPEAGWWFLSADYSQVELRILAHLSRDPILVEAFHRGEDIHGRTASEIFGVSPTEVTAQMRREAKVINFGIIYGMTSFGLSRELGVEPRVAQAYIDGYFQRYRGVRAYIDGVLEEARRKGCVETLMGRRRHLPEISGSNVAARKFAERTAINTPIQGTAADMIKKAMIRIQARLDQGSLSSRMLLQVHDELLLEVPEGEQAAVEELVREEMEGGEKLTVPLKVDMGWGRNWAEAH
jgi:DNA polymerase I